MAAPAATALASAAELLAQEWQGGMTRAEKRAALTPFAKQVRARPAAYPGEEVGARVRAVPVDL